MHFPLFNRRNIHAVALAALFASTLGAAPDSVLADTLGTTGVDATDSKRNLDPPGGWGFGLGIAGTLGGDKVDKIAGAVMDPSGFIRVDDLEDHAGYTTLDLHYGATSLCPFTDTCAIGPFFAVGFTEAEDRSLSIGLSAQFELVHVGLGYMRQRNVLHLAENAVTADRMLDVRESDLGCLMMLLAIRF